MLFFSQATAYGLYTPNTPLASSNFAPVEKPRAGYCYIGRPVSRNIPNSMAEE